MFESKYSKVLTVILVIVIIAIIGLLGYLAFDYYRNYAITKDASDFVDNFQGDVTGDVENTTKIVLIFLKVKVNHNLVLKSCCRNSRIFWRLMARRVIGFFKKIKVCSVE